MSAGGSDLDKYGQPLSLHHIDTQCGTDSHYRAIQQLRACRPIPENQVRELCYKARELLIEEGNVVGVDAPVTVRNDTGCLVSPANRTIPADMR